MQVLAACLLAIAAQTAADDRDEDTSLRRLPVRIELAADGTVLSATARRGDVPAQLRALVEGSAARARYTPAQIDGRPVPSALWVTALTRLHFDADDTLTASVVDVAGGGVPSSGGNWPTPSVSGGAGYGAQVLATVVFDERGHADAAASRVELLDLWRDDGAPVADALRAARGKPFLDAARTGLRRWRWTPDTVDGQPLRGEFAVTLTFASMRDRMRDDWRPPPRRETTYRPLPAVGVQPASVRPAPPPESAPR